MKHDFKFWIIATLMFLVTVSSALALTEPQLWTHIDCEDDVVDQTGNLTWTNTGLTYSTNIPSYNISGTNTKSCYHDGDANDGIFETNLGDLPLLQSDFAVSFWYNGTSPDDKRWFNFVNSASVNLAYFMEYQGKFYSVYNNALAFQTGQPQNSSWYHYVWVRNDSNNNVSLYINGVMTHTGTLADTTLGIDDLSFSNRPTAGKGMIGYYDDMMIILGPVSQEHVDNLYNYNNLTGIYTPPNITNFTVTAVDSWSATSLLNFTVEIDGYNYTTTTGTVTTHLLNNDSTVYDLFVFNANNSYGKMFNRTYENVKVNDSTLQASLHQTEIYMLGYKKILGSDFTFTIFENSSYNSFKNVAWFYYWNYTGAGNYSILESHATNDNTTIPYYCGRNPFELRWDDGTKDFYCYNSSGSWVFLADGSSVPENYNHTFHGVNGTFFVGTNPKNRFITPSAGLYNLSFEKTDWYNGTVEFTLTALQNATLNITGCYDSYINISANHSQGGGGINWFNGYVWNTALGFNESYTTTTGLAEVNVLQGYNYSVNIFAENYSTGNVSESVKYVYSDSAVEQLFFELYRFNSVLINFYDELSLQLLNFVNVTVYFDLISDSYAVNTTTTNGTLYLDLLDPESYTAVYWATNSTGGATNWTTRFYYFTLNNNSYNLIDLYLLKDSSEYNITVTVLDQFGNEVVGAYVKALRYDLATNSYLQTDMAQTDEAGQALLDVTYNDEFYKFMVVYNGQTLKTTNPQYITSNTLTIYVDIGGGSLEFYEDYESIEHSLSFNNATNNFRFTWTDNNGVATNMVLYVYEMKATGNTLLNSSSSTATSGTILAGITPENGTIYLAKAFYVASSGEEVLLNMLLYQVPASTQWGLLGLFLQLLITGTAVLLVRWNIPLAAILAPLTLIMGNLLMLNTFPWEALAGLQVVGIVFAFIHSKGANN